MASTDYAACEGHTVDGHHCVIAEFCYRYTMHQESESERQPYPLPTATDADCYHYLPDDDKIAANLPTRDALRVWASRGPSSQTAELAETEEDLEW